jgi:hypothetical protein
MVYLIRELRAAHLALEQTRSALGLARDGARDLEIALRAQARALEHTEAIVRGVGVDAGADGDNGLFGVQFRLQALCDSVTQQVARAVAVQGVANAVITETMLRAPDVSHRPAPPPPDPLSSFPLGPEAPRVAVEPGGPLRAARLLRMGPHVSLRLEARPPALNVDVVGRDYIFEGGVGVSSGEVDDPIEVD